MVPRLTIDITALDCSISLPIRRLVRSTLIASAAILLPRVDAEVSVVFLSSAKMRKLNATHRKKDQATTTLSFSSGAVNLSGSRPKPKGRSRKIQNIHVGEMFLCLPAIDEFSRLRAMSRSEGLRYILVHSFLHLLGFSHADRKTELTMDRKLERVLKEL
ncbi:MAG: rRNA maturation RNase YbeY [bacterium]|nr:rRNA maturation RNase YbeY [bacterium]